MDEIECKQCGCLFESEDLYEEICEDCSWENRLESCRICGSEHYSEEMYQGICPSCEDEANENEAEE